MLSLFIHIFFLTGYGPYHMGWHGLVWKFSIWTVLAYLNMYTDVFEVYKARSGIRYKRQTTWPAAAHNRNKIYKCLLRFALIRCFKTWEFWKAWVSCRWRNKVVHLNPMLIKLRQVVIPLAVDPKWTQGNKFITIILTIILWCPWRPQKKNAMKLPAREVTLQVSRYEKYDSIWLYHFITKFNNVTFLTDTPFIYVALEYLFW